MTPRLRLTLLGLVLAVSLQGQGRDELSALRWENRVLRQRIDSLRTVLAASSTGDGDVLDTWGGLEDILDEGVTDLTDTERKVYSSEDEELYSKILPLVPVMRIPWHEELKRYIRFYTSERRRRSLPAVLGKYEHYYAEFKAIFQKYGIPEEIIPLCIVESAVSPRARSCVGALGCWQFMPATARGYGMRVDDLVDERMNMHKSTVAAARFLANAFKQFGRWDLAVLSYNCGSGNINKAIIRSGGKRGVWEIYDYLPTETKGYLPSLIAAAYVATYHDELGIPVRRPTDPVQSAVLATRESSLTEMAIAGHLDLEKLRRENPQFLSDRVPADCIVMVPAQAFKAINSLFP